MGEPLRDWTLPTDQEPLGARYGLLLDEVHADLLAIAEGHEPHGEGNGDWCGDGQGVCDVLGNLLDERITAAVPREDVRSWIEDGPPGLLDWHADLQGDTPRDTIVFAIVFDLYERLMDRETGWPRP